MDTKTMPESEFKLTKYQRLDIEKELETVKRIYSNEKVREIIGGWVKNAHTLSDDTALKIGQLFVKEILGMDPKKSSWYQISEHLGAINAPRPQIERFWKGINKLAPQLVDGDENLAFLVSNDFQGEAAFRLLGRIANSPGPRGYGTSLVMNLYFGAPN